MRTPPLGMNEWRKFSGTVEAVVDSSAYHWPCPSAQLVKEIPSWIVFTFSLSLWFFLAFAHVCFFLLDQLVVFTFTTRYIYIYIYLHMCASYFFLQKLCQAPLGPKKNKCVNGLRGDHELQWPEEGPSGKQEAQHRFAFYGAEQSLEFAAFGGWSIRFTVNNGSVDVRCAPGHEECRWESLCYICVD